MKQTRWTLRELLIAMAWLSAGMALFRITWLHVGQVTGDGVTLLMVTHFATWGAFGAGLGTIFRRQFFGAMIGLIVAVFVPCILLPFAVAYSSFK